MPAGSHCHYTASYTLSSLHPPVLIRPRGDWESQTSVSTRSNLPKAPLQQWRQYFVTESLRLLGTQRLLWDSSLFDSVYLSISLPATQLLSRADEHSHDHTYICTQAFPCAHSPFRPPQTHTETRRILQPYTFSPIKTHTHTAFGDSKLVFALFCHPSQQQLQQQNQNEACVKNKWKEKLDYQQKQSIFCGDTHTRMCE